MLIRKAVEIVLIGDGEFRSTRLMGWLYTKGWHYRLRVAKDTYIQDEYGEWNQLQILDHQRQRRMILIQADFAGPVNLAMS